MKLIINDSMSVLRMRLENRERGLMRGIINDCLMPDRFVIWVWDAKGGNDARRAFFPSYKTRKPAPTTTYMQLDLLKTLISHTPAWQAWHDGFEGDDVIAALVEQYRGQLPIEIQTRDGDLTALCGPGVTCRAKAPVPPELIQLYKITVGDPSDTIPGIPGFGKNAWEKADKPLLKSVLDRALSGRKWTDDEAAAAGLKISQYTWLRDPVHAFELDAMRRCVEPLPMSPEQLNAALKKGVNNPTAREALMKEYLL